MAICDSGTGELRHAIQIAHNDGVTSYDFDEEILVTGTYGDIRLWDVKSGALTTTFSGKTKGCFSAIILCRNKVSARVPLIPKTLLTCDSKGKLVRWEMGGTLEPLSEINLGSSAGSIKYRKGKDEVLVCGADKIKIFSLGTGECTFHMKRNREWFSGMWYG